MKRLLVSALAVTALSGVALADEAKAPALLSEAELAGIVAGNLVLPNGNTVFEGFDNPAPGDFHPSFGRNPTAGEATLGIPPSGDRDDGFGGNNEGPWSAHFASPVIGCNEGPC